MKSTVSSKPVLLPRLSILGGTFAVCRLDAEVEFPAWAARSDLLSVTCTVDELSVVCAEDCVPDDVRCERGWRAFRIEGPLDFSLVGVLAGITTPLAEAGVPVFVISTYDTDYVLVNDEKLDLAVAALSGEGYEIP